MKLEIDYFKETTRSSWSAAVSRLARALAGWQAGRQSATMARPTTDWPLCGSTSTVLLLPILLALAATPTQTQTELTLPTTKSTH